MSSYGQRCAICKKENHFAKQCKQNLVYEGKPRPRSDSDKVRTVDFHDDSSSDDEYQEISTLAESVGGVSNSHKMKQFVIMTVNEKEINFQMDSGATCNVISVKELKRVSAGESLLVKKNKSEVLLKMYNKDKIKSLGTNKLACTR